MMGCVYLITNKSNGKQYVGQTERDFDSRWKEHLRRDGGSSNRYFHRAIMKYGEDGFTKEILFESDVKSELDSAEAGAIQSLGTIAPLGYNISVGPPYGPKTESTRRKISKSLMGVPHSPERVQKEREAHEKSYGVRVRCLETGIEYPGIASAARETGANEGAIRKLVRMDFSNQSYTSGGYHWALADSDVTIDDIESIRVSNRKNPLVGVSAPCRNIETGEVFESLVQASQKYGVTPSAILNSIQGRTQTSAGFHWERYGD